jgi:hypothetical protein
MIAAHPLSPSITHHSPFTTHHPLLFALNPFANLAELVVRGLAVCGAAFVGFLLGWGLAWLLNAAYFHLPKTSRWWKVMKHTFRWAGAIVAGILAALILFGAGGGLGFGGGPGSDKGEGPGRTLPTDPDAPEVTEPRRKEAPPLTAGTVQVTLLAPPVQETRFFRLEPDRKPLTLDELRQAVTAKRQAPGLPLQRVEILVYNNSPHDRRLRQELVAWARQSGLTAVEVPIDQEVP